MAQAEHKLKKIAFSKAMRGYSCDEVDTYLAYVNDQYSALARECSELRRKMAAMAAGQNEYREDALREKEKIAAEAQALLDAGKAEADRLVDDARHKAARLLADAETAAASILKEAEDAAAGIPAMEETAAVIAEQSNVADRLVEEIDSFRGEVFAMYAKHIEELERLSRLTDKFYETKEALTEGYQTEAVLTEAEEAQTAGCLPENEEAAETADEWIPETEADPEPEEAAEPADDGQDAVWADNPEEPAEAAEAAEEETWYAEPAESEPEEEDPLAAFYTDEDDDDALLRIDWKAHRAAVKQESEDSTVSETQEEQPVDPFAELWNLTDENDEENPDDSDLTDFLDSGEEAQEPGEKDPLDQLFAADDEEDDFLGAYAQMPENETAAPADEEETFLSGIASEYMTPKKAPAQTQPGKKTAPAETGKKAENLDELLEGDAGSLTDEFEMIYNSKKSADNVAQIRRQPLVDAKKPEKPKKHGNGNL